MHTRDKLWHSFCHLLETRPLRSITVQDITAEAGLTRQAFYRYFHTRDELLFWQYDRSLSRVLGDAPLTWQEMVERMLRLLQQDAHLYRRMARQSDDDTLAQIMEAYTISLYTRIIRCQTGHPPDEELSLLLQLYVSGGIAFAMRWVRSGMQRPAQEMCRLFEAALSPRLAQALTAAAIPSSVLSAN